MAALRTIILALIVVAFAGGGVMMTPSMAAASDCHGSSHSVPAQPDKPLKPAQAAACCAPVLQSDATLVADPVSYVSRPPAPRTDPRRAGLIPVPEPAPPRTARA